MSLTKRWVVYLHENRVNGKKYIGITCQKPERRWSNGNGYKPQPSFYRAIQKYGWHSFRHEILYTDLTQEEAERLEVKLIAEYGTLDPEKGYNLSPGGGSKGHLSAETRRKIGLASKGRPVSAETRAKLSAAGKGHVLSQAGRDKLRAFHLGLTPTDEVRAKMSAAKIGNLNAKRFSVRCVETGETYTSLTKAAHAVHADRTLIAKCCKGQRQTAGGYHWEYADTPIFDTQNS